MSIVPITILLLIMMVDCAYAPQSATAPIRPLFEYRVYDGPLPPFPQALNIYVPIIPPQKALNILFDDGSVLPVKYIRSWRDQIVLIGDYEDRLGFPVLAVAYSSPTGGMRGSDGPLHPVPGDGQHFPRLPPAVTKLVMNSQYDFEAPFSPIRENSQFVSEGNYFFPKSLVTNNPLFVKSLYLTNDDGSASPVAYINRWSDSLMFVGRQSLLGYPVLAIILKTPFDYKDLPTYNYHSRILAARLQASPIYRFLPVLPPSGHVVADHLIADNSLATFNNGGNLPDRSNGHSEDTEPAIESTAADALEYDAATEESGSAIEKAVAVASAAKTKETVSTGSNEWQLVRRSKKSAALSKAEGWPEVAKYEIQNPSDVAARGNVQNAPPPSPQNVASSRRNTSKKSDHRKVKKRATGTDSQLNDADFQFLKVQMKAAEEGRKVVNDVEPSNFIVVDEIRVYDLAAKNIRQIWGRILKPVEIDYDLTFPDSILSPEFAHEVQSYYAEGPRTVESAGVNYVITNLKILQAIYPILEHGILQASDILNRMSMELIVNRSASESTRIQASNFQFTIGPLVKLLGPVGVLKDILAEIAKGSFADLLKPDLIEFGEIVSKTYRIFRLVIDEGDTLCDRVRPFAQKSKLKNPPRMQLFSAETLVSAHVLSNQKFDFLDIWRAKSFIEDLQSRFEQPVNADDVLKANMKNYMLLEMAFLKTGLPIFKDRLIATRILKSRLAMAKEDPHRATNPRSDALVKVIERVVKSKLEEISRLGDFLSLFLQDLERKTVRGLDAKIGDLMFSEVSQQYDELFNAYPDVVHYSI